MEESALKPVRFRIGIYGEGEYNGKTVPFPSEYIKDALSQNILYHCYEQPKGVEELARLCGVPAYYIEDRIDNLVKREALMIPAKGKYRTDFIIWMDEHGKYCEENAEKELEPVLDEMVEAFRKIAEGAKNIDFYRGSKSEEELFYLYGAMAMAYESRRYRRQPYPRMKVKYDGHRWNYLGYMESGTYHRCSLGCQSNGNSDGHYMHLLYTFGAFGNFHYKPMMDSRGINICEDIIVKGSTEDVEGAAVLVQDGYLERRQDGGFLVKSPMFTSGQLSGFYEIAGKCLEPMLEAYSSAVECFVKGYKKLFPKHLQDDAERMCSSMFLGLFDIIAVYARRKGIAVVQDQSICDVLLQK